MENEQNLPQMNGFRRAKLKNKTQLLKETKNDISMFRSSLFQLAKSLELCSSRLTSYERVISHMTLQFDTIIELLEQKCVFTKQEYDSAIEKIYLEDMNIQDKKDSERLGLEDVDDEIKQGDIVVVDLELLDSNSVKQKLSDNLWKYFSVGPNKLKISEFPDEISTAILGLRAGDKKEMIKVSSDFADSKESFFNVYIRKVKRPIKK